MSAEITNTGLFDMQVCVPSDWTNKQVEEFAKTNPCGTTYGWQIRKQGDSLLNGADERVKCADRSGHVHVMLDC